jgi:predicted MFS family arabinose efflux permease
MTRPTPVRAFWDNRRVAELEVAFPVWASRPILWRWHFGRYRPHRRWRPTSQGPSDVVPRRSGLALHTTVLLPFAAGYYLSWIYYTINALIADQLVRDLALSPSELGGLTATYLFGMAVVQIPLGSMSDRRGPRWVQSVCCLIAALGAIVFAMAGSLPMLLFGRFLLGIGTATSFTAGVNAIALWFPTQRTAFATGLFVMLGSLGAVTATSPAEALIDTVGWRPVFVLLALMSVLCAALITLVVPDREIGRSRQGAGDHAASFSIFYDRRFWKLAPVSAACIGTAWSLQSLWAAPWLSEVEGYDHISVVYVLFVMAVSLSIASLAFGLLTTRMTKDTVATEKLLALVLLLFMSTQAAIVLRVPFLAALPWIMVAAVGSATVVSYSILQSYAPKHSLAGANGAFNLVHLVVAFAVQWLLDLIIGLWPRDAGHHPTTAYQAALTSALVLQGAALTWFVMPSDLALRWHGPTRHLTHVLLHQHSISTEINPHQAARRDWNRRIAEADLQMRSWRMVALTSLTVLIVLLSLAVPREDIGRLTNPKPMALLLGSLVL